MTASFVKEVLTSAGQLEIQEATTKLDQLSKKTEQLKGEVFELTTNKYEDFAPKFSTTERIVEEVALIKSDMEEMSGRIENQIKNHLNVSTGEFQSLRGQLEDITCLMVVLEKLANLQDGLEATTAATAASQYTKAADCILRVKHLLSQKVHDRENEVKILDTIKTECQIQTEKLIADLSNKWDELVVWNVPDKVEKEGARKVELKLNILEENAVVFKEVVYGMKKLNILEAKMKKFGERLQKDVLETVIKQRGCCIEEQEMAQSKALLVVYDSESEEAAPPELMFSNLSVVFQFLNSNMLQTTVDQNVDSVTLMSLLGSVISESTLDMMVKDCLRKAIPSNNKELEMFGEVVSQTEKVNERLLQIGFITKDMTTLIDFVQNVTVLFANKKCQEILEHARTLMTTDVHNTVKVSQEKPLGELPPLAPGLGGGKKPRRDDLAVETPISPNTFRLPTCHISTSIQELMTLAYEALHEATESSPQCAVQMFFAVRNMFELFCSVFTTYHRQALEALPQFTALHYNNCMYISHHLMTLGHQFGKKLPTSINATFVDLVPKIRRLGTGSFLQQLAKQKTQLSEYLGGANGFLSVSEKDSFLSAERAVKQTLHQLTHLSKVWQEVLPPSNFRKALGYLLNGVATELIDSVIALEDISADDTKQLSHLICSVIGRATEIFQIPGEEESNISVELQRNVPNWQRFQELDMILNASMIDIGDRWASGKGPLAIAFSADEVKQLIRALFQNTDRRAAMLSKIK